MRFELLTQQEMNQIDSAAKELVSTSGYKITSVPYLQLFEKIGSEVDYKNKIAKVPEYLIKKSLESIDRKSSHIIYARNPKYDVKLGNSLFAHPGEGGTFVIDFETGHRRPPLVKDVENFAILMDSLNNVNITLANIVPVDVHPKFRGLYMAKALFQNTSKPSSPGGLIRGTEKYYYEMAVAVAGGVEEFKKRPLIESPAELRGLSQLCEDARLGIPIEVDVFNCSDSMPSAGGTSPVTLAGTLVKSVGRVLMHIILSQAIKPGTPMRALIRASILDLKVGSFSAGSPEMGMLAGAGAQLMKQYYGLPVDAGWAGGDSKVMDEQLGYEKMNIWLLAGLAGADQVSGMSLLEAGLTASYAQLVIDDELIGIVKRVIDGIRIDRDHLAVDLMKKVGPGGLFTGERDTLKYVREEHFQPKITDRRPRNVWEERGSKDIVSRSTEIAKNIIKTYEPEPLPNDVLKELEAIIKKAEKEYATYPERFLVPEPERIE